MDRHEMIDWIGGSFLVSIVVAIPASVVSFTKGQYGLIVLIWVLAFIGTLIITRIGDGE